MKGTHKDRLESGICSQCSSQTDRLFPVEAGPICFDCLGVTLGLWVGSDYATSYFAAKDRNTSHGSEDSNEN